MSSFVNVVDAYNVQARTAQPMPHQHVGILIIIYFVLLSSLYGSPMLDTMPVYTDLVSAA